MTPEFLDDFLKKEKEQKQSNRRWTIRAAVLLLHVLCIGIPLLWEVLDNFFRPPKVNAFRVKIGPKELSTSPVVGPPERSRPGAGIPAEPEVPAPPKPKPVIPKEPKVTVPPRPKKKIVKKKPVKKQPVKKKKPVKKTVKKPVNRNVARRKPQPVRKKTEKYTRSPGGKNFNAAVPLGRRDRGQQKGKQDNRTPGGGLTEAEEAFNRRAGMYLKNDWVQPPKSLLGSQLPAVTIELTIAPDGRVIGKRITRPSGNAAMDQSVENLLARLDRMPNPPRSLKVEFILMTDD